jgi:anti-anti-sigma regulatory factor
MPNPASSISVAVVERTAYLKIAGRANVTASCEFKGAVLALQGRGFLEFVLDLGECLTMDSTFLGVLTFLAQSSHGAPPSPPPPVLLNPNARVSDLIDTLGVQSLFKIVHEANPCPELFEPLQPGQTASKEDVARTSLEAHLELMRLNPNNVPKFKDVTKFLAEDLKRLEGDAK